MSQNNLNPNKRNTTNLNTNLNTNLKNIRNNGSMSGYSNTTMNTGSTSGFSTKSVIGIILVVVIIIILLGVSYWAYNYYTNMQIHTYVNTEILTDVKDASSKFSIGSGTIPSSKYSNEYSVSMWLNIADYSYNYGKEKVILRRGESGSGNPEIVLDSKNNDLIVRVKLQGPSNMKAAFTDIPIQPSVQLQTHKYGINEPGDKAYIHGKFDLTGTTDIMMVPCEINTVFDKVSGNKVNYPTVQYSITSGCDNALNTHSPTDAMTIMIEQTKRMKEGFSDVSMNKLSDNSAPPETQVFNESFYNAISGGNTGNTVIERFDVTSDYVDASAAVMLDLCKIFSQLEKQSTADESIAIMNSFFQGMLDILAAGKKSFKTSQEINDEIMNSAEDKTKADILGIMKDSGSSAQFQSLIEKLHADSEILMNMETSMTTKPDFTAYQNAVNSKLIAANCKLTFDGSNEFDATISFYENIIKQIKKSLYTYIANLGVSIQKSNPNLVDKQASCLVESATNQDPTVGTCVARMIPLQKWVNVIVSIYNQIIDIYIDGQLASSCVLKGFPALSTSNVDITPDGGFSGQISRVAFSNTAMTVQRAKEIYYDGPIPTDSIFSMIPTWAYYLVAFIIIALIIGSFFM
jgi:hypothetical protein